MAIIDAVATAFVVVLAVAAVVMFVAIVAATFLVTGAVHTEEKRKSLLGPPPGLWTRLARRLLAVPDATPARAAFRAHTEEIRAAERHSARSRQLQMVNGEKAGHGDSSRPDADQVQRHARSAA